MNEPSTPAEWQKAVDMAEVALLVDAARQYGLVVSGLQVNVDRCVEILAEGKRRGVVPRPDAADRFVAGMRP